MFKVLLVFILCISVQAIDFTGKWEIDADKTSAHLKKIGAGPQGLEKLTFEINSDSVKVGGKEYPAYKFKIQNSECLVFYKGQTPALISEIEGSVEVLNYLDYPFICKKTGPVKLVSNAVKGLEGRWNFKDAKTLELLLGGMGGNGLQNNFIKDLNCIEIEFYKNSACLYFCGVPIPFISQNDRMEVHRNSDNDFRVVVSGVRGILTSIQLKKADDKTITASVDGRNEQMHLVKSEYKNEAVKFSKEYLQKELKELLVLIDKIKVPDEDEFTVSEKLNARVYIFFLLDDMKTAMKTVESAQNKINDEDLEYFYENSLLTMSPKLSLKETLSFFEKYIKPLEETLSMTSSYLLLAEKCHTEKDDKKFEYLKLAEESAKKQLKLAKESSEEDYPYEYDAYLYQRAYLQITYHLLGLKEKNNLDNEAPLVKIYYENMLSDDLRISGRKKESAESLKKVLNMLKHLSSDQLISGLLDTSFYVNEHLTEETYILPWKKLRFLDNGPQVDEYDRQLIYTNLATLYYLKKNPALCYLYLFKTANSGNILEQSGLVRILGLVDNAKPMRLGLTLAMMDSAENGLFMLSDYLYFLHYQLENLEAEEKLNKK